MKRRFHTQRRCRRRYQHEKTTKIRDLLVMKAGDGAFCSLMHTSWSCLSTQTPPLASMFQTCSCCCDNLSGPNYSGVHVWKRLWSFSTQSRQPAMDRSFQNVWPLNKVCTSILLYSIRLNYLRMIIMMIFCSCLSHCRSAHCAQDWQTGYVVIGHSGSLLRWRPCSLQEHHRWGRHGLHLPDASVPGRAAVGSGQ